MKYGPENFVLNDRGDINKFLSIKTTQLDEKRFKISQPYLIDRIVPFLGINKNNYGMETHAKLTPVGKPLLHKYLSGNPHKESWNYRTAVGKLTYLQGNTHIETSMAVHQTAGFFNNPMLYHEKYIRKLGRYLYHTNKGDIVHNSDISKGLECYIDADFAVDWTQSDARNADNVMSQTGMVIMYANFQIYWRSSL